MIRDYIGTFLYTFIDGEMATFMAKFLAFCLALGFVKMGIDLIFPRQTKFRTFVYITAIVLMALLLLNSKGITLITINQILPPGGVG